MAPRAWSRRVAWPRRAGRRPALVFASTVVTGDARGALLTEETPLPVQTPYGRSKQEGERLVLESGLPAVVIRPSHVYGPGGWYANELIAQLRQPGRFAVIGAGENLWDVVHVDDVAAALVLAAERRAPGSIYHVVDDEPITFYDFMALTASGSGVGAPRRIPAALARLVAGRNAVDAVVRSARSSNAKIKRELGWAPASRPRARASPTPSRGSRSRHVVAGRRRRSRAQSGANALGLIADVAGDRQRGGRCRRGRVAHVQRPLGGREGEVVEQAPVARERLGAHAGEAPMWLDVVDAERGHQTSGGRDERAPRGRAAQLARAGRPEAPEHPPGARPGERVEQVLAGAACPGGRRRARRRSAPSARSAPRRRCAWSGARRGTAATGRARGRSASARGGGARAAAAGRRRGRGRCAGRGRRRRRPRAGPTRRRRRRSHGRPRSRRARAPGAANAAGLTPVTSQPLATAPPASRTSARRRERRRESRRCRCPASAARRARARAARSARCRRPRSSAGPSRRWPRPGAAALAGA